MKAVSQPGSHAMTRRPAVHAPECPGPCSQCAAFNLAGSSCVPCCPSWPPRDNGTADPPSSPRCPGQAEDPASSGAVKPHPPVPDGHASCPASALRRKRLSSKPSPSPLSPSHPGSHARQPSPGNETPQWPREPSSKAPRGIFTRCPDKGRLGRHIPPRLPSA